MSVYIARLCYWGTVSMIILFPIENRTLFEGGNCRFFNFNFEGGYQCRKKSYKFRTMLFK